MGDRQIRSSAKEKGNKEVTLARARRTACATVSLIASATMGNKTKSNRQSALIRKRERETRRKGVVYFFRV
jgi:hypothetical protein